MFSFVPFSKIQAALKFLEKNSIVPYLHLMLLVLGSIILSSVGIINLTF